MEKFDIELARSKLGALKCEKGLICAESGLETLCKAKRIGAGFPISMGTHKRNIC
jgi:hypothetical protein